MKLARVALIAAAVGLVPATASAEKIKSIVVEENSKTTDETVIVIAGIDIGDNFDITDIDRVKGDLVGSGLFKEVEVFTQPVTGGIKVTILAKDKHSWVIAPTYYNQPTNKGGGLGFGENNLFGTNKKLLLYGQIATGDSFFIGAYVDPSINGTRWKWQYDVYLLSERVLEYAAPTELVEDAPKVRQSRMNYLNTGIKGGINLFRGASVDVRFRGAHVSYEDTELIGGVDESQVLNPDDPSCNVSGEVCAPGEDGWDISTEIIAQYDRRANWYGITSGDRYTFTYERSLPKLGSDFDYWYAGGRFERSRKYFSRHNLVLKASLGYGKDMPFQQEYRTGGTDNRGYRNDHQRGDFKLGTNIEYSVPLFTIKGFAMRALAFWDSAYTTFQDIEDSDYDFRHYLPDSDPLGLSPFKNSVGIGTRIFVRQIVLPLLGLDLGYGLERNAFEVYLAVGLTDF
jgi:outer membrane protein assembly factor BamA